MSIVAQRTPLPSIPDNPPPALTIPGPVAEEVQGRVMGSIAEDVLGLDQIAIARAFDLQGDGLMESLRSQITMARQMAEHPSAPAIAGILAACLDTLDKIVENDAKEQAHWDRAATYHISEAKGEAREACRLIDGFVQ